MLINTDNNRRSDRRDTYRSNGELNAIGTSWLANTSWSLLAALAASRSIVRFSASAS